MKCFFVLLLWLLVGNAALAQTVVNSLIISEIMYNPLSHKPADEWFEVYNPTSGELDLKDWQVTKGVDFKFPAVKIPSKGYLVVAANLTNFTRLFPSVTRVVGGWEGTLANDGETISIENASGETINELTYADEGDW